MAIELIDEGKQEYSGYYFYDKKNVKIPLAGRYDNGKLILKESVNGVFNGEFTLVWEKDKSFVEGAWTNKDGAKKLGVSIQSVYEYDHRSLLLSE
jgi:hypothetical protein